MLLSQFRTIFPEFALASDDYVNAYLAMASARISPAVFGYMYTQAVGFLAAHLMATTPAGQTAKLVNGDGTTSYGMEWERIKRTAASGCRVV